MSDHDEAMCKLTKISAEMIRYCYDKDAPNSYLEDWNFEFWPDEKRSRVPYALRKEIVERCRDMETRLKDWAYELTQVGEKLREMK